MDVAKSKYSPGPPPKESTLKIESQADGLKFTIDTINAEGKTIHSEASPKYDGKDYPMTGNPSADSISLKKINDHTIETQTKKDGKPLTTIRSGVQGWQDAHVHVHREERQRPGCKQYHCVYPAVSRTPATALHEGRRVR